MKTQRREGGFPAIVLRACDGDTLRVLVAVGFEVWLEKSLRLTGIDSPEIDGPEAARALQIRTAITAQYRMRECIVIRDTAAPDCYGRIRGRAFVNGVDLAEIFIREGWATIAATTRTAHGPSGGAVVGALASHGG